MRNNPLTLALPGALLLLGLAFANSARAGLIDCSSVTPDISGKVTPSVGCRILEPLDGNDNSSPALINAEAFFGFDDWLLDGKLDDNGTSLVPDAADPATLVSATGDAQSGTWSLTDAAAFWSDNSDLMFVFKDGDNTNLVGYLIQAGAAGGSYATPFVDPPFDLNGNSGSRDISHIGIYHRGGGIEVPAPAPLALFGIGLLGLGWSSSRRRAGH